MASVERTAITVKIPLELHAGLVSAVNKGIYQNMTSGVVTALEHDLNGTITADTQAMSDEIQKLNSVIQTQAFELQKQVSELQKQAIELSRLQATCEGLQQVIEEKNNRIADLTREVETLSVLAHYFKTTEQKQIEAPASKKKWFEFWK